MVPEKFLLCIYFLEDDLNSLKIEEDVDDQIPHSVGRCPKARELYDTSSHSSTL